MAKRNNSDIGRAHRAFLLGKITRKEFKLCMIGHAWVTALGVWLPRGMGWTLRYFHWEGK